MTSYQRKGITHFMEELIGVKDSKIQVSWVGYEDPTMEPD